VRYNCGVVNESMPDAELERLLTQLLRVVSPAPPGEPAAGQADIPAASALPASVPVASLPPAAALPTVSPSEARALIELVSARGIAQGELAGLLSLEKSTVSRLAAGLERKGWIRRGRDEENQRYVRLYLTPEGGAVAAQVWAAWQSRQARILGALSAEERAGGRPGSSGPCPPRSGPACRRGCAAWCAAWRRKGCWARGRAQVRPLRVRPRRGPSQWPSGPAAGPRRVRDRFRPRGTGHLGTQRLFRVADGIGSGCPGGESDERGATAVRPRQRRRRTAAADR